MADLNSMLQANYGYKGGNNPAVPLTQPNPAPAAPTTPTPQMTKPETPGATIVAQEGQKPRILRSVGDIYSAMQAQRIFNPDAQVPVKPAPSKEVDQGVAPTLGVTGRWGTPQNGG